MLRLRTHALIGLLIFAAAAAWRHLPALAPGAFNWAEPGNVAAALVEGRGFSDPFGGGTGPTAWIPPLPVLVDADVFAVAGIKTPAAAAILIILTVLGLSLAHALVVSVVTIPKGAVRAGGWYRTGCSLFFIVGILGIIDGPLDVQSEMWIDILLSAALLKGVVLASTKPTKRTPYLLAIICLLCPLAHAGLALAVAACLALLWVLPSGGIRRRPVLLPASVAFLLALGAWTARNALVLHRFVPLKSNGWFELYLTNVASPTGLLRAETALRTLPYFNQAQFDRYSRMGEMAFVDSFKEPDLAFIREHPRAFASDILTRAKNALVFCQREDGSQPTHTRFAPADRVKLAAAGEMISVGGGIGIWTRMDDEPDAAEARIHGLGLKYWQAAFADWVRTRDAYNETYHGFRSIFFSCFVAGFPVAALLAAALAGRGRLRPECAWAALIAAAMLAPYILINHGIRHQMPLLAIEAAIVGGCLSAWVTRKPAAPQ